MRADFKDVFLGNTWVLTNRLLDLDDPSGTKPLNITGGSIKWVMKRFSISPTNLISLDMTSGKISLSDPQNGVFTVTLAPGDTNTLPSGTYYYEGELTDVAGNVSTVIFGDIEATKKST